MHAVRLGIYTSVVASVDVAPAHLHEPWLLTVDDPGNFAIMTLTPDETQVLVRHGYILLDAQGKITVNKEWKP